MKDNGLGRLYTAPVTSRRTGAVYNAFSYPTKIDPEAVAIFLAAHTVPGDTVLDVFAGSGTTGLAARLCENPTDAMRRRADDLRLRVVWGPRHAVLYELGVLGSLVSNTMCNPPDPVAFEMAAKRVVASAADRCGWMYAVEAPDGRQGVMRHAIWSDVTICSACGHESPYWTLAVGREPLALRRRATCVECKSSVDTSGLRRVTEVARDAIMDEDTVQRRRVLAHVYGRSGRATWNRPPVPADLDLVERVLQEPIPAGVPSSEIRWGDLYRSGYHEGIKRIHHFYTRRNLIALGTMWAAIEDEPKNVQDALRLLVLSYNGAHATLMTRVVVKSGMKDFVLTGAQSGVLYVSSLPVEKNVLEGVRRKIDTFKAAFTVGHGGTGTVRVVNASSTRLDLPDRSIDYVFTDPPFGGFIPYAEVNQINEAWLGVTTDTEEEAIISPAQGKDVGDYARLMKQVFAELARVMKDDALATVVFHSSQPDVWAALGDAFASAGFVVDRTSVLDKTQISFKQVVSEGSTRGDAIFLLSQGNRSSVSSASDDLARAVSELRRQHGDLSPQHLYSRYVARCVEQGTQVALNARDFYASIAPQGGRAS